LSAADAAKDLEPSVAAAEHWHDRARPSLDEATMPTTCTCSRVASDHGDHGALQRRSYARRGARSTTREGRVMPVSLLPQILELVWAHATPGREACCQNEILREVRELLQPGAFARIAYRP
jgi:hypothetical protein